MTVAGIGLTRARLGSLIAARASARALGALVIIAAAVMPGRASAQLNLTTPPPSAPSEEPSSEQPSATSGSSSEQAGMGSGAGSLSSAQPARASLLADLDPATLLSRGLDAERELDSIEVRMERAHDTRAAVEFVTRHSAQIEREALSAYERVGSARRWSTIVDHRYRYATLKAQLEDYRTPITTASELLTKFKERAGSIRENWSTAKKTLAKRRAPQELIERATSVAERATGVERTLEERALRLTSVNADLDDLIRVVDEVLETTEQNSTGILRDYWMRGPYPHQHLFGLPPPGLFIRSVAARAAFLFGAVSGFAKEHPVHIALTLLTWALTSLWIVHMRRERVEQERTSLLHPETAIAPLPHHTIHYHPIPAGALVATVVGFNGIATLPSAASLMLLGMAVSAAASLLLSQKNQSAVLLGVLSLVLYGLVAVEIFVDDFAEVTGLLLLPEALVVGFIAWKTVWSPVFKLGGAWATAKGLLARAWFAIVVLGVLAWLAGYEVLADVCIEGTSRTVLLAIVAQAVYTAATALLSAVLHSDLGRGSLAVASHRALIQSQTELVLRLYLLYRWFLAMLDAYTLRRDLRLAFDEWMASPVRLGSIEFPVGAGLTLVFGIVLAVIVARVLRFVLERELLPRTGLRTGTTAAIGSGTYFVAMSAGVFLTIAAAGMRLDRIAILVSALGVGIGFGLQNIVQNFVAGLILLFGRPINVGDVVEVKDLTGQVTAVGARASTIRTFQGAEVIVPNSFFIADQVINWTLSDETRRIDLDIGVAYGADPERVLALLRDAVKSHQHVLAKPPVNVLFTGFGESALHYQVRVWTKRSDIWVDIKSELGIAMNRALREAGISIPFPQRDVYLHQVPASQEAANSSTAQPALKGPSEAPEQPALEPAVPPEAPQQPSSRPALPVPEPTAVRITEAKGSS